MQQQSGNGAIGILTAYSILILAIGLMNHVMVIPPLLQEAKRDAWASVLATLLPYLVWTSILFTIMKKTKQQPLFPWLTLRFGTAISWAFRLYFIIYLFSICMITLKETTVWTHASYLPRTPQLVVSSSLVLLCAFAVHAGIRAIAVASGVLLPFVIIFGDFVMSANLPQKNYSLLTPLLENGWTPFLKGSMYVGGGLSELLIILLIQHQIKSKVRLWSLCLLSSFLILLIMGPVTGAIAEFGPFEAAELRYPAFEEWRLVTIGKYIRHVDFLSIYQWLSGAFVRIAISMFLLIKLLPASQSVKRQTFWLILLGIIMVILVELPVSDKQYAVYLKKVYLPASLWGSMGVLVLLMLMVLFPDKAKVEQHEA